MNTSCAVFSLIFVSALSLPVFGAEVAAASPPEMASGLANTPTADATREAGAEFGAGAPEPEREDGQATVDCFYSWNQTKNECPR